MLLINRIYTTFCKACKIEDEMPAEPQSQFWLIFKGNVLNLTDI